MSTVTRIKGSVEDHVTLGVYLASKAMPADKVVAWLKVKNYTLKGKTFNASHIAYIVAGIEAYKASVPAKKTRASKAQPTA